MSSAELVALVCCDLSAVVRGRSLLEWDLDDHLRAGVSWVPANHSLTPHGPLADRTPFGSTGDLRLLPDPATRVRVEAALRDGVAAHGGVAARAHGCVELDVPGETALELVLCDIVETDGTPWDCCPRRFLRDALGALERELGARVVASFEHEFQLATDAPAAAPFSLEAQRRAEPFAAAAMGALLEAGAQPERFFPEFAAHQFEIPVA
ncbi:MAG: hypothetical protein ACRDLF_14150, partial [Solirubrobacteraceae bacterium]